MTERWAECGVDLILAGHAHRAFAGGDAASLRIGNRNAVIVQPNSFNAIHVTAHQIRVTRLTWRG